MGSGQCAILRSRGLLRGWSTFDTTGIPHIPRYQMRGVATLKTVVEGEVRLLFTSEISRSLDLVRQTLVGAPALCLEREEAGAEHACYPT